MAERREIFSFLVEQGNNDVARLETVNRFIQLLQPLMIIVGGSIRYKQG